jgi:hypothetical protein
MARLSVISINGKEEKGNSWVSDADAREFGPLQECYHIARGNGRHAKDGRIARKKIPREKNAQRKSNQNVEKFLTVDAEIDSHTQREFRPAIAEIIHQTQRKLEQSTGYVKPQTQKKKRGSKIRARIRG